jgi:hypothetical protein
MMIIISLLMLLMPGLIAARLHGIEKVTRGNLQPALFAYLVYSLVILFLDYAFMFVTHPVRTVSFSPWVLSADSQIYSASFVFKYLFIALLCSLTLPALWHRRRAIKSILIKKWYKIKDGLIENKRDKTLR